MIKTSRKLIMFIIVGLLFAVSFLAIILQGCGNNDSDKFSGKYLEDNKINVSVVYSARQNSDAGFSEDNIGPYIMSTMFKKETIIGVDESDSKDGDFSVVSCDGTPKQYSVTKYSGSSNNNKENRKSENQESTKKIIQEVQDKCVAKTEESDIMSAIGTAASYFSDKNDDHNYLVVCDSGISTKGLINFQTRNVLSSSADDFLANTKLPNLNGVERVDWFGFNETADPQEKIPVQNEQDVKDFYTKILNKAGVKEVNFKPTTKRSQYFYDDSKLPKVTEIKWPETDTAMANFAEGKTSNIVLDESQVRFEPDKTSFVDEAKANEVISNVADALKNNNAIKVTVNGYIASQGPEVGDLSQRRADKIKSILVSDGIDDTRVTSVGKGQGPYPYYDEQNNVNSQNRYIEIVKN